MVGLIGKKIGMTQAFDESGRLVPVTVIAVEPNVVVRKRTEDADGYSAVILGAEKAKESRVSKPVAGQFGADVEPRRHLVEFRDFDAECEVGQEFAVDLFENVSHVDVSGAAKGKGYQGVMRRHGFSGGRKTHGSKFHRTNGSTGMAAWPSKVIKGTKMAGRMGERTRTILNLRVERIDVDNNLLLVRGSIPGRRNTVVRIRPAVKKVMK